MKVEFKFDLDDYEKDDNAEMTRMLQATKMSIALNEIHSRIFRPYYKHGYSKDIEDLIALCPDTKEGHNVAYDILEKLHDMYIDIVEGIDLEG